MQKELAFGLLALAVNVIGYIPYILAIPARKVQPSRVTWAIWTILTGIIFFNQIVNNGGYSTLFIGSSFLLVGIVFLLSFKYGFNKVTKFDLTCLVSAVVLLVVLITSKDTVTTTYLALLIDAIGLLPTARKAFQNPETEKYLQWITSSIGGLFGILALNEFKLVLMAYPTYVLVGNALIVFAKYLGESRVKFKKTSK